MLSGTSTEVHISLGGREVALSPWVAASSLGPTLSLPAGHLRFDPQKMDDAFFLKRLLDLDAHVFGPRSQQMPSWVLYDCALAPGAVFGFAARHADLPPWLADSDFDADPDTLVPISMMNVLPLPNRERLLVHTLAWLGAADPSTRLLGRATLRGAIAALGLKSLRVVAGWSTPELTLFAELAPLTLVTAWTPAHDVSATATFDLDIPLDAGQVVAPVAGAPDSGLAPGWQPFESELVAMQARIERGEQLWLVSSPGSGYGLRIVPAVLNTAKAEARS
jgi:hypothetical protein